MTVLGVKGMDFRCSMLYIQSLEPKLEWLRVKQCLLRGVSQAELGWGFTHLQYWVKAARC